MYEIKNGAIFVADAHYCDIRPELLGLLSQIESGQIATTQLFLMGDIFDLLIPPIAHTVAVNVELIEQINRLSNKIEIFYFEGNHDFLVADVLKNIVVFPMKSQQASFMLNGKRAILLHGDKFGSLSYSLYCTLVRSRAVLFVLKYLMLDFAYPVFIKKIISSLKKKMLCRQWSGFEEFAKARVERFLVNNPFDYLIDGHFHQGTNYTFGDVKYKNIHSFACSKSFFQVEFAQSDVNFLERRLGELDV